MLNLHRQHRREGHWDGAKDPEGIEITLSAEYKMFSQSESWESRDVEQNRSLTTARLRTRLLELTGTVK